MPSEDASRIVADLDRLAVAENPSQLLAVKAPDDGARNDEAAAAKAVCVEELGQPLDDRVAYIDRRFTRPGVDVDADRFARADAQALIG